jgi:small subunit ribosomal protein S3
MGQKVHPTGFRLGITEDWSARWYADKKTFGKLLVEDQKIRKKIKRDYYFAGIPKIEIERTRETARITLHSARPGLIIGRKGAEIDKLKDELEKLIGKPVTIKIKEVPKPELDAQLVAENIAEQLQKRTPFRRVMRKAVEATMGAGAQGVKIRVSGRLAGAEIARSEAVGTGKVPLHTLMADISYGFAESMTTYGTIGVKAWIYRGMKGKKDAIIAKEG